MRPGTRCSVLAGRPRTRRNCGATRKTIVPRRLHWKLFLRSDFGIDDWTLVSMEAEAGGAPGAAPLAQLSALVAATTLLFVGLLGLIQVRRTMVPLERLIAGTRRLSEHDYSARVALRPNDEFGELARSFNHMAERIDHQMQALRVQSSIDHEILNGLNVARVLQRVAHRLEQVVPGATACVVEFDRTSRLLARVHGANGSHVARSACHEPMRSASRSCRSAKPCCASEPPPWLLGLRQWPSGKLWVRGAKAGDELLGMLVIGAGDHAIDGDDTRREIAELCDRVSVTLSSADRERRLLERATHDSLTGLANRAGLYESIDARLAEDRPAPFSVLFIDLDRFKEVNDSLGHQVGDELLRAVARRLQHHVPAGTLVARPGGDEFVLVVRGPRACADELALTLCSELAQPLDLGGRTALVGASIGMAHHPEHGSNPLDLMRRADMAMYSAKARGGGTAAWFEPALDARVARARRAAGRSAARADARRAGAALSAAHPHAQRQGHRRRGAAALATPAARPRARAHVHQAARGDRPDRRRGPVGHRSSRCSTGAVASAWHGAGVDRRQSVDATAAGNEPARERGEILARHGLRSNDLELEVTESIFMGDASAAIRTLQQLHDSGIRIALDDFGTGYSSLSYLHKLPIGIIKVDRSFVVELGQRDSALALTRSIVALARALHLRVVAEGVETQQQADLLTELGCDELQGFLYAPALDPAAFAAFVAQPLRAAVAQTA